DTGERYSNAADRARAWAAVFAHLDHAEDDGESAAARASRDAQAASVTLTTPLAESGLSPRVLSALRSRADIVTVGELIATSRMQLNSLPGLGERYRRELAGRVAKWRARLPTTGTRPPGEGEGHPGAQRAAPAPGPPPS